MLHRFRLRRGATIAVTTATALAAVGVVSVATGAIPGSDGTIDACYDGSGNLRVIDKAAGQVCNSKSKPLSWNQQGDTGDTGPQGPKGDKGDPGVNGSPDTPEQVLTKLKQVDSSGSGLDADTVDGADATALWQQAGIVVGPDRPQIVGTTTTEWDTHYISSGLCEHKTDIGIPNLRSTDRLIVHRLTPPVDGLLDTFGITTDAVPRVTYNICNTTDTGIYPPPASFRVVALSR